MKDDLTEEEKQEVENELKRLDELSASSGVEAFDENLTEDDQDFNKNHRFPNGSRLRSEAILEEIGFESDSENLNKKKDISYEEWQTKLVEKYQKLHDTVQEHLPNLWESLEFELSIQKILNIKDCTLPFAGIVLGRPSSLKTVGIEMFRVWNNSFYTDNFSAKAFVSHSTAVKRQELGQIDLLPKIKNKLFLTPELSPTFTKKDDDLIEILGILTRVLDGQGYESDTGAHGHRGYFGEYMFTWVGAAVDIPYKVHRHLGNLGAKLYFLRLPGIEKEEDEYLEEINNDDFIFRTKKIREVLLEYLIWFENCPVAKENDIVKIPWNFENDNLETKRYIVRLGRLLAHLRGVVSTWETKETQGIDYAYTFANIEEPDRAIRQLTNLARGHALSQGRNYITIDDISLIINVVLSTASTERSRIFETLLNFGGSLTTRQIMDYLDTSDKTAKRTMTELKALGLVTRETIPSEHGEETYQITLNDKFEWFLTEEFNELRYRKNFAPLLSQTSIQNCTVPDDIEGGHFSSAWDIRGELNHKDIDYPPDCYYCHQSFHGTGKQAYDKHIVQKHPGKPGFPGPADIEIYKLTPKGMDWEK
jgi:predicted transcriptional regulator